MKTSETIYNMIIKAMKEVESQNADWRSTANKASLLAADEGYDYIADLLYAIKNLKGTGAALLTNASSFLKIARIEMAQIVRAEKN